MFLINVGILVVVCVFVKKAIDRKIITDKEYEEYKESKKKLELYCCENLSYNKFLQKILNQIDICYLEAKKTYLSLHQIDVLRIIVNNSGIMLMRISNAINLKNLDKKDILFTLHFDDYNISIISTAMRTIYSLEFKKVLEWDIRKYCKEKKYKILISTIDTSTYVIDLDLSKFHLK